MVLQDQRNIKYKHNLKNSVHISIIVVKKVYSGPFDKVEPEVKTSRRSDYTNQVGLLFEYGCFNRL